MNIVLFFFLQIEFFFLKLISLFSFLFYLALYTRSVDGILESHRKRLLLVRCREWHNSMGRACLTSSQLKKNRFCSNNSVRAWLERKTIVTIIIEIVTVIDIVSIVAIVIIVVVIVVRIGRWLIASSTKFIDDVSQRISRLNIAI